LVIGTNKEVTILSPGSQLGYSIAPTRDKLHQIHFYITRFIRFLVQNITKLTNEKID